MGASKWHSRDCQAEPTSSLQTTIIGSHFTSQLNFHWQAEQTARSTKFHPERRRRPQLNSELNFKHRGVLGSVAICCFVLGKKFGCVVTTSGVRLSGTSTSASFRFMAVRS